MALESGELIAVLIVVIILIVGTVFLCFRCWKAVGEVAEDHMKPKRETRMQMVRGAVRRSFRRRAAGLQRGAGHIRNSFRRARGLPPGVPAPEEPGPPTRPYGARGGARRYPGRAGHPHGGPGQGHPQHGGSGQPSSPRIPSAPGQSQSPGQPQAVPSVSAHTPDGPGHSDLHPAYLPDNKRPTGSGSQSDAPPTYQEALLHETPANRAAVAQTSRAQVHKSPAPPAPQRIPSAPSETPPPVPPTPYPEQLAVPSGYQASQGTPRSPHDLPSSPYGVPYGMPDSPRDMQSSQRGVPQPRDGYPGPHPGQSPHTPFQRSPYQQTGHPSQYDHGNRPNDYRERQEPRSPYGASYPNGTHQTPTDYTNAHARDRDRPGQSHDNSRDYWRSRSQPETHREPSYNPDYSRSRSQEVRDYPHLMTSHPAEDNEYTQPPVPVRNYALYDDDDGGFGAQTPRNRRMISSSNVPRDYVDYRSHDQYRPRPSGDEDVDYAGYSQIPPRAIPERDPPYSPTSPISPYSPQSGSYHNAGYERDTRLPGDGAYMSQGQGYRSQHYNDTDHSPYHPQRGPLPPIPREDSGVHYNTQQGVVFPISDRRYMDSDTYI